MIDVEPLITRELERLVPQPAGTRANWDDVVGRAGIRPSRRRTLVFAFAFLVAVLITAAAVARSLGGFDAWLSGRPGKPADEDAQSRFEAANGRSWASFPTGTRLRELIRTDVDDREFVLYGFRSGSALCLQLAASGFARQPRQCAPVSAVANAGVPIVVLNAQWVYLDRAQRPIAEASYGIVADGVDRVGIHAIDGFHAATLGGNAYLFVGSRPNTGNRILAVSALDGRRRLRLVRIDPEPWRAGNRRPPGPAQREARIANPKVGWLERGEKPGFAAFTGLAKPGRHAGTTSFRFLKPEPPNGLAVGLSKDPMCVIAVRDTGEASGAACGGLFGRGPVNTLISCDLCGGFMEVRGVVADGVERLRLFLADGTSQTARLDHNLFAARVASAQLPIRIVGYDARNRVVAAEVWGGLPRLEVPRAATHLRPVFRRRGPNGTTARLYVGPTIRGFQCWRVRFSSGALRGSCVRPFSPGPQTSVELVQPAGRDLFFVGPVGRRTRRIEIRFANGDIVRLRPVASHYVVAVPREHLSTRQQRAFVIAFDSDDRRTTRQRVFFRLP